jgi:hypothetical protein
MSALLIEPILDRYAALVEKRERDLEPERNRGITVEAA